MALHILVVENDTDVRETLVEMLTSSGFLTTQADGGTAMREVLTGKGLAVDAIVLDCKMAGEPTAQLALHAKQLHLPVVMISGSPEAIEFARENELQLLHKPFRIADLQGAIEAAMASGKFGQRGG